MREGRLPSPSGAYPVGDRLISVDRPEAEDADSSLTVHVWYPSSTRTGRSVRYAVGRERTALLGWCARRNPSWNPHTTVGRLCELRRDATADLEFADDQFPLVVWSHGADMSPSLASVLASELASHGFIVASVLQDDGGFGRRPDGSLVRPASGFLDAAADMFERLQMFVAGGDDIGYRYRWHVDNASSQVAAFARAWTTRMRAVADALLGGDPLCAAVSSHVLPGSLVYGGFSFGGSAAAMAAHTDMRAIGAVNLDGLQHGTALLGAHIRVPLLMISSEHGVLPAGTAAFHDHNDLFYEPFAVAGTTPDVTRLRIMKAKHRDFTDLTFMDDKRTLHSLGAIEGSLATSAIGSLMVSFLERLCREGGPGPNISAPAGAVREVNLRHVREWVRS